MDLVVRHHAFRLIVVVSARVQVPGKAREVGARDLDPETVPRREVVGRGHGTYLDFIHLARLHEHLPVVAVPVPDSLDGLIQVVGRAVRVHVEQFHREVRVARVGRHVERDADRSADLDPILERLGGVDEDVLADRLSLLLIEGASADRPAGAAHVAAVRHDRVHRIVGEAV